MFFDTLRLSKYSRENIFFCEHVYNMKIYIRLKQITNSQNFLRTSLLLIIKF